MTHDEYKEFPCDLCGKIEAIEVPHVREYTNGQAVHICINCGFVYVNMRRSARIVADDWSDNIFGSGYTAAIPAVKARLTYVAEFIDGNLGLNGKRVCDIGGGEGLFLDMIRQRIYGASPFGIEPSATNCDILADMGIDHYLGTIEEYRDSLRGADPETDIVTIMWTLENCTSCLDMLTGAHQILKNGGSVVVATGSRILVPFKKPLQYYFGKNTVDTHSFRFSANTLRGILAVSGFEVTHVNRFIDNDVLCMIAKKVDTNKVVEWERDNYLDVYSFFERWHIDTKIYYGEDEN